MGLIKGNFGRIQFTQWRFMELQRVSQGNDDERTKYSMRNGA